MARVALTKTTPTAVSSNGTNVTDLSTTNMATGDDNGVTFAFDTNDVIVLDNDTAGAAVYTFKIRAITGVTDLGGSITDPTVTVAASKKHLIKVSQLGTAVKQTDGDIYVDCDVAANIAVLNYS